MVKNKVFWNQVSQHNHINHLFTYINDIVKIINWIFTEI